MKLIIHYISEKTEWRTLGPKFPTVLLVKKIFLKIQHRTNTILGFPFSSTWVPKILITTCRFQVWKAPNCLVCYCQSACISFWQLLQLLLQRWWYFLSLKTELKIYCLVSSFILKRYSFKLPHYFQFAREFSTKILGKPK